MLVGCGTGSPTDAGSTVDTAASCTSTSEPSELGGCLPARACSGVTGHYVLTRGLVDAGCQVQWSNPLTVNVALDAGCVETSSIRWASDAGCDFRVHGEHSMRFLMGGACWGVWHTIDLAAAARPRGGPSFTATTGGFGEGGSCPASFALDAGT